MNDSSETVLVSCGKRRVTPKSSGSQTLPRRFTRENTVIAVARP
jgi:hypothetical protein